MSADKNLPCLVESGFVFTGAPASELLIQEFGGRTYNCLTESLLGGFEVVEAIQVHPGIAGTTYARVQFHGGMNTWQFVLESSLSDIVRGQHTRVVGSLAECLERFEQETGLEAPPVTIIQIGVGISVVTSKGVEFDARNPFRLAQGAKYEVPLSGPDPKPRINVMVVEDRAGRAAFAVLDEAGKPTSADTSISPLTLLTQRALEGMRRLESSDEIPKALGDTEVIEHKRSRQEATMPVHARSSYRRLGP